MLQSRGISEQEINARLRPEEDLIMEVDQVETSESNDVEMEVDDAESSAQSKELSSEQVNMFYVKFVHKFVQSPTLDLVFNNCTISKASHPYALEQINQF